MKQWIFACIAAIGVVALASGPEDRACESHAELWINSVVREDECLDIDCITFRFHSPVTMSTVFTISSEPEVVLRGCDIEKIRVGDDAVTLLLSQDAFKRLRQRRDVWRSEARMAAFRLPSGTVVGVQPALGLYSVVKLFDFENASERRAFAIALSGGAEFDAPSSSDRPSSGSEEGLRRDLTCPVAQDADLVAALDAAIERGEGDEALAVILARIAACDSGRSALHDGH